MGRQLPVVDSHLAERDVDGLLISANGDVGNQRYLSGFDGHDPFETLYTDGDVFLLIGGADYTRAQTGSYSDDVYRQSDLVADDEYTEPTAAEYAAIVGLLREHCVSRVLVPERFPLGTARELEARGIDVVVDGADSLLHQRSVKTDDEVAAITLTQRATEAAMAWARMILAGAEVEGEQLVYKNEVLTGARLKAEIEKKLLEEGAALRETIVACGPDSADPHGRTSGPLRPHESILIDIFPESMETGYHADMTRTFVKGDPSEKLRALYQDVHDAFEAALEGLAAGVTGDEICHRIHNTFRNAGHRTVLDEPGIEAGALHSGGHGVGLDVHELPSVRPNGAEFEAGNVITVEPGLYYPEFGGIRIEDIVEITEYGYNNLSNFPKVFVIE